MSEKVRFSIYIDKGLREAVDAVTSNRSGFISEKLLDDPQIQKLVSTEDGERKLSDLVNEAISQGHGDEIKEFILAKFRKKEAVA